MTEFGLLACGVIALGVDSPDGLDDDSPMSSCRMQARVTSRCCQSS